MPSQNVYLTIKEFANLADVSKQTLIYYDSERILPPAFRDQNGYRYYDYRQIDLIVTIQALKTIGLSIKEIRSYMEHRNAQNTYNLFHSQVEKLIQRQKQLLQTVQMMKTKCSVIEKANLVTPNMIYVEYHPTALLFKSKHISFDSTTATQYKILSEHLKYRRDNNYHCGREIAGIAYWKKTLNSQKKMTSYSNYYTIIDEAMLPASSNNNNLDRKEAGNYLTIYHKGSYTDTYKSYPLFEKYAKLHNLKLSDFSYEESLIDEVTEACPDNYITQISIPFENANKN